MHTSIYIHTHTYTHNTHPPGVFPVGRGDGPRGAALLGPRADAQLRGLQQGKQDAFDTAARRLVSSINGPISRFIFHTHMA